MTGSKLTVTHAGRLTDAVLIMVFAGAVLTTAVLAPNALRLLAPFVHNRSRPKEERERVRQALQRLKRRRLVSVEWKGDEATLVVTAAGKRRIRRLEFERLTIERPTRWDRRWRLVVFDIPEQFAAARAALRVKLKSLGFLQMQRSVFVYPYECRDEADFVIDFFHVRPFVQYLESADLDHREGSVRRHFGVL